MEQQSDTRSQEQDAAGDGGNSRRTAIRRLAFLAGPLLVILGALWIYFDGGRYVSEENAYVKTGSVAITPEVGGRVTHVAVTDNQTIKKGDLLLEIDPQPYQIAVDGAKANLGIVKNKLQGLIDTYKARSADIKQAQASVNFAQSEFDRIQKLQKDGTVSQSALDAARRDLLQAQAQLSSLEEDARSALAQLGGNVDLPLEKQAEFLQAQAADAKAERDLRLTRLTAPFDGTVTQVDTVQPGTILAADQPAFYLVSNTDVWVEANLKETAIGHVRPGDSATIVLDAYPQTTFQATVENVSPASGATFALLPPQNATGNWVKVVQRIPVRLKLEQVPDQPRLIEGMSATVDIDTGYRRTFGTLVTDLRRLVGL